MNTNNLVKSKTYKPKDALRLCGESIPENQRGRMSRERVEMIKSLVADGYSIEGYATISTKVSDTSTAPTVERKAEDPNRIVDLYYRYNEADYKAVGEDGTIYSMRDACNNCGLSLVGHTCDRPSVYNKVVEVVRK